MQPILANELCKNLGTFPDNPQVTDVVTDSRQAAPGTPVSYTHLDVYKRQSSVWETMLRFGTRRLGMRRWIPWTMPN